jgi:uncharacterized protein (DUF1330 family)
MRTAALIIFVAACSSPLPVTRPLVVTSGVHRIATITVVDETQANDLRAAAEAVRDAHGNLGVSVARRINNGKTELTLVCEWSSEVDARRCARDEKCAPLLASDFTQYYEVLFEATQ